MPRVEYDSYVRGRFLVPISIYGPNLQAGFTLGALVDTGSTKCMIPAYLNDRRLHLPIAGTDGSVETARGRISLDYVMIPRMMLLANARVTDLGAIMAIGPLETGLYADGIEAWLGDYPIIGMNFLDRFDITLGRDRHIIFEL